ncbi:hypothetical protein IJH33_00165 [Candidatus Saccharibacteria bacterium]|nr:hypothetical protein [Candidatus Saccharibacteria bacterium]
MYYYSTPTYSTGDLLAGVDLGVWGVISIVLALIGGILAYFLFVQAKTEPKGKFLKWLKDFLSFKIMLIEPIMKICYYIATIFCVLVSFSFISYSFVTFILVLIFGPIVIRLGYELIMMFIMIWRNTRDIAKNTEKK